MNRELKRFVIALAGLFGAIATAVCQGKSGAVGTERIAIAESDAVLAATQKFLAAKTAWSKDFRVIVTDRGKGWLVTFEETNKHPGASIAVSVSRDGKLVEIIKKE